MHDPSTNVMQSETLQRILNFIIAHAAGTISITLLFGKKQLALRGSILKFILGVFFFLKHLFFHLSFLFVYLVSKIDINILLLILDILLKLLHIIPVVFPRLIGMIIIFLHRDGIDSLLLFLVIS
jgi:hypothetical protein